MRRKSALQHAFKPITSYRCACTCWESETQALPTEATRVTIAAGLIDAIEGGTQKRTIRREMHMHARAPLLVVPTTRMHPCGLHTVAPRWYTGQHAAQARRSSESGRLKSRTGARTGCLQQPPLRARVWRQCACTCTQSTPPERSARMHTGEGGARAIPSCGRSKGGSKAELVVFAVVPCEGERCVFPAAPCRES